MTQPHQADGHNGEPEERTGPTIRDRRRIDPDTFEVREQQSAAAPGPEDVEDPAPEGESDEAATNPRQAEVDDLTRQVAERTDDLQRLQAEYVNYKRRVDRDRETARGLTIGQVMTDLLPILDNISSARDHGELVGGFKAVAEDIEKLAARHKVAAFGEVGDEFDPHLHEALMQVSDPGDAHPACVQVFQVGYRMADRVLRPARVATGAPVADTDADATTATSDDDAADPSAD
ncbi:MAG TPA: nucleotide exchange factor GrpE [Candidatus Avipropionibacterium avicola]|uniref:Protein GrpE n=1 Tax=Candidatus Avipropionibacterium avicola TaxID=2840701 RepID=A0A9D1GW86_9ACTN|nr:nucleotide exchange factor GrpE [Candidatus Avipropionibacterium avicola]